MNTNFCNNKLFLYDFIVLIFKSFLNKCNNLIINVIKKYPIFTHLIITKNNKCNNKIDYDVNNKNDFLRYKQNFFEKKRCIYYYLLILLCYVMLLHLIISTVHIHSFYNYLGGLINV